MRGSPGSVTNALQQERGALDADVPSSAPNSENGQAKRKYSAVRGKCVVCKKNLQKKDNKSGKFRPECNICLSRKHGIKRQKNRRPGEQYKKFKKATCGNCGFIPLHPCQLDVDHVDGNHSNHDASNLQTLCANCHRLKTFMQRWGDKS